VAVALLAAAACSCAPAAPEARGGTREKRTAATGREIAARDANGGTWAFSYPADDRKPGAMLDLRALNEKTAGESGFVRLTPDGSGFALGSGKPVRFWAVGSDVYRQSAEDMARHARFLARLGVNMVRIHSQLPSDEDDSQIADVNAQEIDGIWKFVAALKKEGIYVTISPYWAHEKRASRWGIAGYTGTTDLWGLLFFDPKLQAGYKAWVKALYGRNNPYTGIPLSQDPAVAIIQVQNEDSLFFWTTQGMKPEQQERLGVLFGRWLVKKYGSLENAKRAWDGTGNDKDHFAQGVVGLNNVWPMTQPQSGGMAKRVHDEVEFYAETQAGFYADIVAYYRKELGCRQLINASNWITADPIRLNDIERWTYTAADVIAVNRYYNGGTHIGENNGWRIDPGHYFTDQSATLNPRDLPTNLKQVVGHPMIITESSWVAPLGHQSEGPFLIAAYESLTGVDAFYWFSETKPEYDPNPYFDFLNLNGQHPLQKWTASIPAITANFPACALLYRLGYLKQGDPVVHEERTMESLWNREIPLIAEDKSFDPNRNTGNTGEHSRIAKGVDPLAFLVGPVEVKYGGDPAKSRVADLSKYIDHAKKTVRSVTGQIVLNYDIGLCTINAPKAQGAAGFLNRTDAIKLDDVTIRSGNDYATVAVVSMDDRPLRTSGKILVQVGTTARPTGWKTEAAEFKGDDGKQTFQGYRIVSTGAPPWQIVNTSVTLTVANPNLTKAILLDSAGFPAQELRGTGAGGRFTLRLPPNTMYVVLE
jgi:hypothetical protein